METIKQQKALNKAIEILKAGGVVVCPTDTVYGFLADAQNKKAVNKIYKIKERPKSKPLPFFVSNLKMAKELAQISKGQEKILKKKWPGKFTFVLKDKKGKKTIALRVPKHNLLSKILKKINRPLAQTSVNISGQPELNNIKDIEKILGVDLIIDGGNLPKRKPSTIMDLSGLEIKKIR